MMDRRQSNKNSYSLSAKRRVFCITHIWILIACIALSLPPVAQGQFECLTQCQEQFAACLQAGQGDPISSSICQDRYDACCAACIGF